MKAEIISVGTELLLGHTINSDAAFVARELASLGIGLTHCQVVGDNAGRLEEALRLALRRSDIVITTGGLGPTKDDLTKETVAKVAGAPLVEDAASMAALMEYFGERQYTPNQLKQALMPKGSTVFANSVGTAPGCATPYGNGQFILVLPGPPAELKRMLEDQVRPFLAKMQKECIFSQIIRTFGIGEGEAASMIADLMDGENPTVAPYASDGEMFVKVTARARDEDKARELARPVIQAVCQRLGDVVYGLDEPGLEHMVVKELIKRNATLATAESCTGGLLARRITDQPGASAVFRMGLVTYSNEAKEKLLGISADLLKEHGAVSWQTAQAMAQSVRGLDRSDFGIGITGIAGPDGGTAEKPVGLVHIALAFQDGCWLRVMQPRGRYLGREWTRMRASSNALDLLRRYLLGLPQDRASQVECHHIPKIFL